MNAVKINFVKFCIFFLIITFAGLGEIYDYSRFVTFGLLPFLTFYAIKLNNFKYYGFRNLYAILFLMIIFLAFVLLPLCIDVEGGLLSIRSMLGVYLSLIITIELLNYQKYDFRNTFLISNVIAFVLISGLLIIKTSGFGIDLQSDNIATDEFDLNANVYSYYSYFANISLFYLIQLNRNKIYIWLSILCLCLGVYISFYTASRSGMLFTMLIALCYWPFIFDRLKINLYLRFTVIILVIGVSLFFLYNFYETSFLHKRVQLSLEQGDARDILIRNAIDVFIDHPFTGVGPDQFRFYSYDRIHYSHNSYTEIAANMGIGGLFLLLMIFFRPLLKQFKSLMKNRQNVLLKLNILAIATFILINNIYVFYLTTFGMMYFFMILMLYKKPITK